MNRDYESMVKKIDEMLVIRKIDKFLDKIDKKKNKEREERKVEPKKSKGLPCQVVIYENIKEEIFELPEKPKREIVELYAEPQTEKYKRKIGIDWKKELNLA
jgi:RNA recognition motif-containing protein